MKHESSESRQPSKMSSVVDESAPNSPTDIIESLIGSPRNDSQESKLSKKSTIKK